MNTPDKYTVFKQKKFDDVLTLSVGINGVIDLKTTEFNSRYSGSKKYKIISDGTAIRKVIKKPEFKKTLLNPSKKIYQVNSKEVKARIANWINCMGRQKNLFFYTISFPTQITDTTAYKCLNSWLTTARSTYELKNYLWVAERQKNGTIHFHIAIEKFLPVKKLNATMRNLLHFYIRKNELKWSHLACSKYNGLDINKDRKTKKVINYGSPDKAKNLGGYLSKYISKSSEKFTRQAWQCSKKLSSLVLKLNMTAEEFMKKFIDDIDCDKPMFENDFCCFYKWKSAPPTAVLKHLSEVNQYILSAHIDDFIYDCEKHYYSNPLTRYKIEMHLN